MFTHNYVREGTDQRRLDSYVPCILWSCEMGRVAKMIYVAFDLDTVKLLMNIFVRDLMHPNFVSCQA